MAKIKRGNSNSAVNNMAETQGGVKFELVGLPDCMDESKNKVEEPVRPDEVMVFDMSTKPAKSKPKKPAAK